MFDYVKKMATEAHANIVEMTNNISADLLNEEPSTSGEELDKNVDSIRKIKHDTTHVMETLDKAAKMLPPDKDDVFINIIAKLLTNSASKDIAVQKWLSFYNKWVDDETIENYEILRNTSLELVNKEESIKKATGKNKTADFFEFDNWTDNDDHTSGDENEIFKLTSELAEKSEIITALEEENKLANQTIEKQNHEVKQLTNKIKEIEDELVLMKNESSELEKNNEYLNDLSESGNMKELTAEIEKKEVLINEMKATEDNLSSRIKALEDDNNILKTKLDEQLEVNNQLRQVDGEILDLRNEFVELQKKFDNANADHSKILDAKETYINKLHLKVNDLQKNLDLELVSKNNAIESLNKEMHELKTTISNASINSTQSDINKDDDLLEQLNEKDIRISELTQELEATAAYNNNLIESLNDKLDEISKDLEEKNGLIDEMKLNKDQMSSKITMLTDQVNTLKDENNEMKSKFLEQCESNDELKHDNDEISILKDNYVKLQDEFDKTKAENSQMLEAKETYIKKLHMKVNDLQKNLDLELVSKNNAIENLNKEIHELKTAVNNANAQIIEANNEVDDFDRVIEEKNQIISAVTLELDATTNSYRNTIESLKKQVKEFTAEIEKKEELINEMKATEDNLSSRIKALEDDNNILKTKLDEQLEVNYRLRQDDGEISDLKNEFVKLQEESGKTAAEHFKILNAKEEFINSLQLKIDDLQKEHEQEVSKSVQNSNLIESLNDKLHELSRNLEEKHDIINQMKLNEEHLFNKISSFTEQIKNLEDENNAAKLKLEEQLEINERLKKDNGEVSHQRNEYDRLLEEFDSAKAEYSQILDTKGANIHKLQSEINDLQKNHELELLSKKTIIEELHTEISNLKSSIDANKETLYQNLMKENEVLKRDFQLEQASSYSMKENIQKLQSHIDKLKNALTEKEVEITEMAAELSTSKYDNNQVRSDNSIEMDELRKALSSANIEIDRLSKKWDSCRLQLEEHKKLLNERSNLLEQVSKERDDVNRKLVDLREIHSNLKIDFEKLCLATTENNKDSKEFTELKKQFTELEFSLNLVKEHLKRIYYDENVPDQNFSILVHILQFDPKIAEIMIQVFNRNRGKPRIIGNSPGFLNEFENFIDSSIASNQMQLGAANEKAFSMTIDEPLYVPDDTETEKFDGVL